MAKSITAVANLYNTIGNGPDQTTLNFTADYNDERNKEWAEFTPSLSLSMTVTNEVAKEFQAGKSYLLTFEDVQEYDARAEARRAAAKAKADAEAAESKKESAKTPATPAKPGNDNK